MVNLCAVRKLCDCNPALKTHKFPKNPDRRACWASKVPLKNFCPNDNSVLCSSHFASDAYKVERTDTNKWRTIGPLTKKNLTDNAVPTIWPNCPAYFYKVSTQKRSSLNSSGFRLCTEEYAIERVLLSPRISCK